jgi:hypothetical protein
MRKSVLVLLAGTALLWGASVFCLPLGRSAIKVRVGQACTEPNRPSFADIDHKPFNDLLRKYVDDRGLVAYARWKTSAGDMQALDAYLIRVGCVDRSKDAPKAAHIAYWINVYNALTLKGILREYPIRSIRDRASTFGGYNIWKDLLLWVDNRLLSLDDIEHLILRRMAEPRIHAALVCGSKGCPPLSNRVYTPADLDEQLTANARRFFARPSSYQVDPNSPTIYLSPLLQWYGGDFGATTAEQLRALQPLLPDAAAAPQRDRPAARVRFLDYDWSLNDQNAPSR